MDDLSQPDGSTSEPRSPLQAVGASAFLGVVVRLEVVTVRLEDAPSYLTLEQLQAEIKRYTYRSGWAMSVFGDPFEGPCFYLEADVRDAYDPGKTVPLRIRAVIPPIPTREYFGEWLQKRLIEVEIHECREYLRRDGKILYDPHDVIEPGGKGTGT
jgi:hypothetical protein